MKFPIKVLHRRPELRVLASALPSVIMLLGGIWGVFGVHRSVVAQDAPPAVIPATALANSPFHPASSTSISPANSLTTSGPSVPKLLLASSSSTSNFPDSNWAVPWEYSPYKCKVWISFSPRLRLSEDVQLQIHRGIRERLEADFGGTCTWQVQKTPDSLFTTLLYRIDRLTYEQLLARETTLVVAKSEMAKQKFLEAGGGVSSPPISDAEKERRSKLTAEQRKELEDAQARAASINSVRTLDSALDRISSIAILPLGYSGLKREAAPYLEDSRWGKLTERLSLFDGGINALQESLENGETLAALVPKSDVAKLQESARPLPTRLPWQPEAMLRESDKIFMVAVEEKDEVISIGVRELDAYLNHLGPLSTLSTTALDQLQQLISFQIQSNFSTLVRVEESDPHTATLRVRAGELAVGSDHPARFEVGDVLLPFVRRTDVNDNATLIQQIPFTYVAATEKIDQRSLFYGAIFTASQGALTAAKNRRTQRLGLKIKNRSNHSELNLNYRPSIGTPLNATPAAATGIEIFERVPGTDGMKSIGRTDWRGVLKIVKTEPPKIRYRAPHTSLNQAVAQARKTVLEPAAAPEYIEIASPIADATTSVPASTESQNSDEVKGDEAKSDGVKNDGTSETSDEVASTAPDKSPNEQPANPPAAEGDLPGEIKREKKLEGEIALNVPIYLYYIKSGDVLLARIPIVVGAAPLVSATLPDDRRRLETEAYLKGIQSEILDLVVRRKILESRFEKYLADGKTTEAKGILEELKRIKSYDRITEELIQIQNRALTPERGQLGPNLESRILAMTATTRQLIDKWLQEDLVRKLENRLRDKND